MCTYIHTYIPKIQQYDMYMLTDLRLNFIVFTNVL